MQIYRCPDTDEDLFQARVRAQASKDESLKAFIFGRNEKICLLFYIVFIIFIYIFIFPYFFFQFHNFLLIGFSICCPYFSVKLNFLHLFTLFFPRSPLRVTATDGGPLRRGSDLRKLRVRRFLTCLTSFLPSSKVVDTGNDG